MKCSLGISNFLKEISSLSHSTVSLYCFASITEEGFVISPCYSLELCIQMGVSFLFSFAFSFSSFQLFVRPLQKSILPFCICFSFYSSLLNHYWQEKCWIPAKKDSPRPGANEKPKQGSRTGEITFRIKPYTHQRCLEGSNKTLCIPGPRDPTETEPDLCLSVSCGGVGQKWTATGTGALDTEDLGIV